VADQPDLRRLRLVQPVLVIYNPIASQLTRVRQLVGEHERAIGLPESRWLALPAAVELRGPAIAKASAGASAVIAVGGDGLVRCVASALMQGNRALPLGIIPTGTGNLLARNVGLPVGNLRAAVRLALSGAVRAIDVAEAQLQSPTRDDRHYFLVMAGLGIDADMAEHTPYAQKRRLGWLAYVRPVIRSAMVNSQQSMTFSLDSSDEFTVTAHTAIVGNCGTLTANLLLLPDAIVDDGVLDLVVLSPRHLSGWTRIWTRLAIGGFLTRVWGGRAVLRAAPRMRALRYGQLRTLDLRLTAAQTVQLDGDSYGSITRMRVLVHPAALSVRVGER
jgi:diacylglycerol kinase (ATP)